MLVELKHSSAGTRRRRGRNTFLTGRRIYIIRLPYISGSKSFLIWCISPSPVRWTWGSGQGKKVAILNRPRLDMILQFVRHRLRWCLSLVSFFFFFFSVSVKASLIRAPFWVKTTFIFSFWGFWYMHTLSWLCISWVSWKWGASVVGHSKNKPTKCEKINSAMYQENKQKKQQLWTIKQQQLSQTSLQVK